MKKLNDRYAKYVKSPKLKISDEEMEKYKHKKFNKPRIETEPGESIDIIADLAQFYINEKNLEGTLNYVEMNRQKAFDQNHVFQPILNPKG